MNTTKLLKVANDYFKIFTLYINNNLYIVNLTQSFINKVM